MEKSFLRKIEGEDFIFDYRRVIYWPRRKVLLAADLHWGKTHYLRAHGIAISDKIFERDLRCLSSALSEYQTNSLVVLGDLVHHEKSLSEDLIERVSLFRHENQCELILVKGNHDRYAHFPESWGIVEESGFYIDQFYLTHELDSSIKPFQFAGHHHPVMRLRSGVDELRFPTYILDESFCLLPAFSHLTGGQDIKLKSGQEALVVVDEGIESFKN